VTNCNRKVIELPGCKRRKLRLSFDGGNVSSDGGGLLLREADRKTGLTRSIAALLDDPRRRASSDHSYLEMLRQRVYGLALGYEDLNDHDNLRHDFWLQTLVGEDKPLASSPTLSRFENAADQSYILKFNRCFVDVFLSSFKTPPTEIILDFDSTDDRVQGQQENGHYRSYYGEYCFLPLYVYCGEFLLGAYLRPGNVMGYHNVKAVLKLLVNYIRKVWPKVKILYRADCDFMHGKILRWCENNNVDYIVGIRGYANIKRQAALAIAKARERFKKTKQASIHYTSINFQTHNKDTHSYWPRPRRIVVKAQVDCDGELIRFLVTNLKGGPKHLYRDCYNQRGNMENRIKEQKLALFSDRTSCKGWFANHFRMLMSATGYVLMHTIRRLGLQSGEFAAAQCSTIRVKLLKIGAVVTRNTRKIRIFLASSCPFQQQFLSALSRLCPD